MRCAAWCPAPCRPGGPAGSGPAGTKRSPGREQEAERPAHHGRPLVGGGDVLEAEPEQQTRRGLDNGGGAGAVPGRAGRVGRPPARPLDPVAGRRPAGQGGVGGADGLGGGVEGGGVAAGGDPGGGEGPAEARERGPDPVDRGGTRNRAPAAGPGVLVGPEPGTDYS